MSYTTSNIAILIATFNGEKYINELFESLLNQSEEGWIAFIHDDGSSDKTVDIISEYKKKYPEKFVLINGEPTGGSKNNFFYLFEQVTAPIYMCCDQDDVWLHDKIEKTLNIMKCSKEDMEKPRLVHTDLKVVDKSLNTISESMNKYQRLNCKDTSINHLMIENTVTGCTMMINKKLRDMMLQVKNVEDVIMHDGWAAMIASVFGEILYIDEPTILYRQHGDNVLGTKKFNLKYILYKLFNNRKGIKDKIKCRCIQAGEFVNTFNVDNRNPVTMFAKTINERKIKREFLYIKSSIRKSTVSRTIGLYLFG